MTWITPGIPHHIGSNGISPTAIRVFSGCKEGSVTNNTTSEGETKVEHGGVKALVTSSSKPTHTKVKRLVSRRVPVEAAADAGIMRQKSIPVLQDIARDGAMVGRVF